MVLYKCNRCHKIFKQKSQHDYHTNRKNPCKRKIVDDLQFLPNNTNNPPILHLDLHLIPPKITENIHIDNLEPNSSDHVCNYCKKTFSRSDSLNRHLEKSCKIKKQQINQKEELFQKLLQEFGELKKQNIEIKEQNIKLLNEVKAIKINTTTNIDNSTISTINNIKQMNQLNNINIKVVAFRKEDLSHINDDIYAKILNKGFKSVQNFVEYIHFDRNKPENNNVYISNMRDKHVLIYDGENWKLKEKDEILQQLVDDKTEILSDKFDEMVNRLDEPTIKKFKRFLDQKDDDNIIAGIKNDLRLLLYNSRRVPEKARELAEASADNGKIIEDK